MLTKNTLISLLEEGWLDYSWRLNIEKNKNNNICVIDKEFQL